MDLQLGLLALPANNISGAMYGIIGFVAAIVILSSLPRGPNLDAFPAVGSTNWPSSWWAALKYLMDAQSILQKGYEKHKFMPFKVPDLYHWTVILSSRAHLEELAKASEDEFSFIETVDDQIQLRYTVGAEIVDNPYHVGVLRSRITRNIQALYPGIRDEILTSFDEILDLKGNEWKSISVLGTMEKVVCRTTNRAFVGLPLCRNPDWIDLNIRYTIDGITGGILIRLFPSILRGLAARFLTNIPRNIARATRLLGPIIEERKKYLNEYGSEWDDKPNDLLSWLMEEAEGPDLAPERLVNRILATNFAAIHSSSNFFTQVLLRLVANPQYIQPLREEVECIVAKEGWSKAALGKMRKVDSFLKECQRIEGINIVILSRKALKDFTFSDGTFIPKGTSVAAPAVLIHYDGNIYENPESFEPFRFANMPEEDGMGRKYQFGATTIEHLAFGHGTHACPGRFLAASELKTMLAHIVMAYDIKSEDGAACPASWRVGNMIGASSRAKIMFRIRVK